MPHNQPELLVADSFRVRAHPVSGEPEVRNLLAHFARFEASALEAWQSVEIQAPAPPEEIHDAARKAMTTAGIEPPDDDWPDGAGPVFLVDYHTPEHRKVAQIIDEFLEQARAQIATYGAGWPRLELWGVPDKHEPTVSGQELRISLRSLPALGERVEARTAPRVPATHPERKGPNISRYAQLNRELGAEGLLTDELGRVIEGSSTSLVWWQDGTLCISPDGGRVSSVTEYALRDFAQAQGIATQFGSAHPAELASHEVWALNALHGIRTVASIDGSALPAPDEDRLREFQAALDATWQPVSPTLN